MDKDGRSMMPMTRLVIAALLAGAVVACSGSKEDQAPPATAGAGAVKPVSASPAASPASGGAAAAAQQPDEELPNVASPYDSLPDAVRNALDQPFTGDFDAMTSRRLIRVGVTFNRTHYFIDKGQQRGLTYE